MLKNLTNRLKCTEPTNVLISKNVGKIPANLSKRRKVQKASKSKRVFAWTNRVKEEKRAAREIWTNRVW